MNERHALERFVSLFMKQLTDFTSILHPIINEILILLYIEQI